MLSRYATTLDNYRDTCDDAYGDLHDVAILDDTSGKYGFGFTTCTASRARFADMSMMWLIDLDRDAYFEYSVGLFFDSSNRYRVGVMDISSSDDREWTLTYAGEAVWDQPASMNGAHLGLGAVPWHALDYASEFMFDSRLIVSDTGYDELPEVGEEYLLWPYSCNYTIWRQATVRTEPGATQLVIEQLRSAGLRVTSVAPGVGSMAVAPVTAAQRRLIAKLPGVRSVAPSNLLTSAATNDPEPTAWALSQIRAQEGWKVRPSADVTVAVVDDGVDATRPDLNGRIGAGRDSVWGYDLPAGSNSDRGGHGTAVAGVIAATYGNHLEVAGMNPAATVIPYRVSDAAGCISDAALVAALDHVATHKTAQVVNTSLGGPFDSPAMRAAVDRLLKAGIPIVAAVGNESTSSPRYPAAYPGVIAVGATNSNGAVTGYSNTGSHVFVVAPGGRSAGSRDHDVATLGDYDSIAFNAGTSFAAPYVAGAISLFVDVSPSATPSHIAQKLSETAIDIGTAGRDDASGYGIIDVGAFLRSASQTAPTPTPTPTPVPSPSQPATGGFDGDPSTTERLATADPYRAAVAVSKQRFGNDRRPQHVVLARGDQFADALAGSALTRQAPLLFSLPDRIPDFVLAEIDRVMPGGGRVYLLGGSAALSQNVVSALQARGHSPQRLHGPSRIETATAVANQVVALYGEPDQVLVARAYGPSNNPTAAWADAISAGAYAASRDVPLVLSGTDDLHPATKAWLDRRPSPTRVLLGGTGALSSRVEQQVGGTRQRVAGTDRADTAVRVANNLWKQPFGGERNYVIFNGYHPAGWAFGLSTAGLGADAGVPALMVSTDQSPQVTLERVTGCTTQQVDLYLAGNESLIPAARQQELDARDGQAC